MNKCQNFHFSYYTHENKRSFLPKKNAKFYFLKKSICGENWKNIHSDYWPLSGEVEKPLNQGRAWEGGTGAPIVYSGCVDNIQHCYLSFSNYWVSRADNNPFWRQGTLPWGWSFLNCYPHSKLYQDKKGSAKVALKFV